MLYFLFAVIVIYFVEKKNNQTKLNKIRKLSRERTLIATKHPPTEIRTDHGNETSIYILNIYLFLTLVS